MPKQFLKKNWWIVGFTLFLGILLWQVWSKAYILGPFDFLVGFYDPFHETPSTEKLMTVALQYKNFLMSDVVTVILPIKFLVINLIKHFTLPLWNPYILAGSPLFANIQSAVLNPFNMLYLILPAPGAYMIFILLQPVLAFIFMYTFLQELKVTMYGAFFGSLVFSFSSFFVVWMTWGTLGYSFLWLPFILWATEKYTKTQKKKYGFFILLGLVLSFFAGHTQVSLMVWGVYLLYCFYLAYRKKFSLRNGVFFAVAAMFLSMIQIAPAIEMYRQSPRDALATVSFYKDQTLYFSSYIQSVIPDFFGNPVTRNWWGKGNYAESAIYFGTLPFFLALYYIFSKSAHKHTYTLFFVGIGLLGILLSTQNFFSYLVFQMRLPLLSSSTFSRYSALFIFAGAVLSGFGFDLFLSRLRESKTGRLNSALFVALCMVGMYWFMIVFKLVPTTWLQNYDVIKRNSILPTLVLLSIIGGYVGTIFVIPRISLFKKFEPSILFASFTCIVLSVELFRFSYKYIPFAPQSFFYPPHALISQLQKLTMHDRYIGYLPANINSMYRLRSPEGSEPLYNKYIGELASTTRGVNRRLSDRAAVSFSDGEYKDRVLDLFSVRYFVDKTDNFRNSWVEQHNGDHGLYDKRFTEVWTDKTFKIYESSFFLPRQSLFYNAEVIEDDSKILERLIAQKFDYEKTVVISTPVEDLQAEGVGTIKILEDAENRQVYEIKTSSKALLLVTDSFYPGWNVYIDGVRSRIMRVNYAFRGVEVPIGKHIIVFNYQPKSIQYGVVGSIIGLILVYFFFSKRIFNIYE